MADHPWDSASWPSRFWLLWLWPVLLRGSRQPLQEADLYDLPRHLRADRVDAQQRRALEREKEGGRPTSVVRVLLRAFGWRYPIVFVVFSIWLVSLMLVPVFTDKLLAWVESEDGTAVGLALAAALVLSYLVNCNAGCQWYQQTTQLGYEFRVAVALLVFRRVLRLRVQDVAKERALNLVQVDAERLYIFAQLSHLPGTAIVVVIATSAYLVHYEGADVALVAISVVFGTVVLQAAMSRVSGPARRKMQQLSDQRVGLLAQILDSFRVLKMYGWLPALAGRLRELRRDELKQAACYLAIRAFSSAASYSSPMLSMIAVLAVLHGRGERLSAHRAFLIYTVVGLVRAPLGGMAIGVSAIIDGVAAAQRLQAFVGGTAGSGGTADVFKGDDTKGTDCVKLTIDVASTPSPRSCARVLGPFTHSCEIAGLSGRGEASQGFKLSIDFGLQPGELVAITGRVASGKSSTLLTVLGEMSTEPGASHLLEGTVAYLAQPPWIRSGTVRQAVIQDLPLDEAQYWRAMKAAQLFPDLVAWAGGDAAFVGGRGLTLSGGQRARLGLAHLVYRCLVSRVDIALLDDCLSAVDVHVAEAIVEEALLGIVLDGRRSVMMVMNSNFVALPVADRVLAVEDGQVSSHANVESWLSSGSEELRLIVKQTMGNPSPRALKDVAPPEMDEVEALPLAKPMLISRRSSLGVQVLSFYLGAGSVLLGRVVFIMLLVPMLGTEALRVYTDYLMSLWAEQDQNVSREDSATGFVHYVLWALLAISVSFIRAFLFVGVAVRTSRRVHDRLLDRIAAAPVTYFDVTPAGSILNHFSKDMDALDTLLPQYALDFAQDIILLLGVVAVVVWSTPPTAVAVVPVLLGFYAVRVFFSRTAREARRLDSAGRGPLYSAVADATDGLATIRAHRQSTSLVAEFAQLLDRNGKAFFQNYILQPWCILTLDSLGALIVAATSVSCVLLRGTVPPSAASMAIAYALMTRGKLQFCIRLSVEAENQLIAVERLQHLEEDLPEEEDSGKLDLGSQPWPSLGAVSLRGVSMRYRPGLPLALQGLDLEVTAGTKVGLVGRTGSGKSSLLAAVLRLVELEAGSICIDGVDLRTVPLNNLRAAVSVIPQDPVLWSGSLAFNLDPRGLPDKASTLEALAALGLSQEVEDMGGLAGVVEARGANLSLGQRQLLCVARGVLQERRVVLLDEATSVVDGATDARIQAIFRERFRGSTVMVVAHRVGTILDADQIVVLEAGAVVEQGAPAALRADPGSRFAKLAAGATAEAAEASPGQAIAALS